MTTNTTPSQAASFRSELLRILRNMYLRLELDAIDDEIYSVLGMIDAKLAQAREEAALDREVHLMNSHMELMNAASAKHRIEKAEAALHEQKFCTEEWKHLAGMAAKSSLKNSQLAKKAEADAGMWAQRYADAVAAGGKAESRLAEIQRGVHGLERYGFDGKFGGDFGGDPLGPFVKIDEVRALLQPPSQSDTSGLPG